MLKCIADIIILRLM